MSAFAQDLPPKEGYRPFQIQRIPLRTIFGGRTAILICMATTIVGHYVHYFEWRREKRNKLEMRSAVLALQPILMAERDRAFLKQLKRNVAEEKELMRYFPSWKVGTFFGEPIYKTIPEDEFIEPDARDFYVHADEEFFLNRMMLALLN